MSNFLSNHFHTKRLYVHMFDIADTAFSYGRGSTVCWSLQDFPRQKKVLCVWSKMQILHFYFVGQYCKLVIEPLKFMKYFLIGYIMIPTIVKEKETFVPETFELNERNKQNLQNIWKFFVGMSLPKFLNTLYRLNKFSSNIFSSKYPFSQIQILKKTLS